MISQTGPRPVVGEDSGGRTVSVRLTSGRTRVSGPQFGYTPLPPWSCGISGLRGNSRKVFGFKELTGKIFRTKDLALERLVPRRYAR